MYFNFFCKFALQNHQTGFLVAYELEKKRIIYQNVPTEILHPNSPILIVQEVGVQTRLIGNVISHGVKSKFMKKVRRKHVDIN
jgi:hypothetical protein